MQDLAHWLEELGCADDPAGRPYPSCLDRSNGERGDANSVLGKAVRVLGHPTTSTKGCHANCPGECGITEKHIVPFAVYRQRKATAF
jgi:hypothetical protein